MPANTWKTCVTSLTLAAVTVAFKGMPWASVNTWCLVPEAEVVTAGLAAAAAQFGGQVVPGDAGLEDEEDAGEDLAVVQGLAAGEAEAARGRGRQQGPESLPERVSNQGFHGPSSFSSGD